MLAMEACRHFGSIGGTAPRGTNSETALVGVLEPGRQKGSGTETAGSAIVRGGAGSFFSDGQRGVGGRGAGVFAAQEQLLTGNGG